METVDYIVIGAGSAGCVVADILSRDGTARVAVIEAGGTDRRFWIKLPIGYGRTFFDARINWKYETEPDPGCDGRVGYWPRGKVLGGSSAINALIYCRGLPQDFNDWRDAGCPGWGWDDVKPHYDRLERRIARDGAESSDGPVCVADVSDRIHPASRFFFAAAAEAGLPLTADINGDAPEGVGCYQITTRRGMRWSAADGFLRPALRRRNVRLHAHAVARRIVFDGKRAVGVVVERHGRTMELRARREVILCAGAIGSPQLLQVSGIGPGALLRQHGIEVIHDNVHVGGNLQDHLAASYHYRATVPTLNNELAPLWGKLRAGLAYVVGRGGPLSLSVNQCGGFVRSSPPAARPDMQLYFNPVTYTTAPSGRRPLINPDRFAGFQISAQPARPTSRGRIDIRAPDPAVPPRIAPNSLSTQHDLDGVVASGRLVRSLVATAALGRLIKEPLPPDIERLDDDGLIADFRARAASVFHPTSTCAMGLDTSRSVVDPALGVHGVEGLRVIDASVFPSITSGNTNAPTIMVAHKGAEAILAAARN